MSIESESAEYGQSRQRAQHADSEASLRAHFTADLVGVQGDLSSSLIELRNSANPDSAAISQGEQQLAAILAAKQKLAVAGPGAAGRLAAEISSIIASAASTARTLQSAANGGGAANSAEALELARSAARQAVADFEDAYFKQRKFDAFLKFESEEDERRYREREGERQQQIEQARAQGTPEGDKRTADLSVDQMRDAGSHGADKCPEFAPLYDKLAAASDALGAQMEKATTKQSQVSQPAPDPLDAPSTAAVSVPADLLAKFKSAGVLVADQNAIGHGVSLDATPLDRGPRLPS